MALPRVYVIVLSWNSRADTLECIGSLEQSSYPNSQIVLVDNASSDGTVGAVRRDYPFVHLLENGRNLGFVEGNNVGIRYALEQGAEYILLLNDDTVVEPDAISTLVAEAEKDPQIGVAGPTNGSYYDREVEFVGVKVNWDNMEIDEIQRSAVGLPDILDTDAAHGCAILAKASVVREIGLLDPSYYAYQEDVDWCERTRCAGYRVIVVPRAKIFHKGSGDQIERKTAAVFYYSIRNRFLLARRYLPFMKRPLVFRRMMQKWMRDFQHYAKMGSPRADAILDGLIAGLIGSHGDVWYESPGWIRNLAHSQPELLLFLINFPRGMRKLVSTPKQAS